MTTPTIIPYSEEQAFDLSCYADLNRRVTVIYRNGMSEQVEITSSPTHFDRVVVKFDAIKRAFLIGQQNFALCCWLRKGSTFISNLYSVNGRALKLRHPVESTGNEYDIVAVSLRCDDPDTFFATPVAKSP